MSLDLTSVVEAKNQQCNVDITSVQYFLTSGSSWGITAKGDLSRISKAMNTISLCSTISASLMVVASLYARAVAR